MMLSVSRLYSVNDGMINECGAVDGMRIDRETKVLSENLLLCPLQTYDPTMKWKQSKNSMFLLRVISFVPHAWSTQKVRSLLFVHEDHSFTK
jgi:hypothetical protein